MRAQEPRTDEVKRQVERILASDDFRRSSRLSDFLAYVVEETLEGRQDRIKAFAIGIEVLGRDAAFDPQTDPVVRIEAGRLRRELEHYYLTQGRDDPVGIEIPKGGYVPHFHFRAHVSTRSDDDAPPARPRGPRRPGAGGHWRWTASAVVVACLFALVWAGSRFERGEPATSASPDASAQPGILVLPFADLGGGGDLGFRAAAISDELQARLSRFREVTVIVPAGPEAAGPYDPSRWPAARYLLEGSVRADEARQRVSVRLVERASGAIVWSEVYDLDPKATDLIALEQDIASRVATAVAQPYGALFRSADRAGEGGGGAADGYRCALDFYAYRRVLSAELHAPVRACLQRSVAAAPANATAWAMLSYAYLDEDRYGFNPVAVPEPVTRALEAARRAVQLDPANVRAMQSLMTALFFNREPQEALRVGEQAYRLNPDDTELLGEYGSRLMQAGQHARGMAMMEEALARNPGTTGLYSGLLALGAYLEGDDVRALGLIRSADLQRFPVYHFVATLIYARNSLAPDAAASRETFLKMRPAFFTRFDLELDKRNFNAADRAKITADALAAGFPVSARPSDPRAY